MWKKGAVAALAAALLVAGVVLLYCVAGPRADAAKPTIAKAEQPAPPRLVTVNLDPQTRFGSAAEVPREEFARATQGPSAGIWNVLRNVHASAGEEREALVSAFRAAPGCLEKWCDEARNTLSAWEASIAAKVPGALTTTPIECSAAGCWTKVTLADPMKWRDVHVALPTVTAQMAWPGPSILGGPDFQRGSVVSIWAVMPVVNRENRETSSMERGEE